MGHPHPTAAAVEGLTQCGGRGARRSAALEGAVCSDSSCSQVVRIRRFQDVLALVLIPTGFLQTTAFSAQTANSLHGRALATRDQFSRVSERIRISLRMGNHSLLRGTFCRHLPFPD